MEMLYNRSFTHYISDGQHNRLRRLKNGVPHVFHTSPNALQHLHPHTVKKVQLADNCAILLSDKSCDIIESGLMADISTLSTYQKNRYLKLSVMKSLSRLSSAFHLMNRKASCILNIVNSNRLQIQDALMYLGVKLDLTLIFCQYLENLSARLRQSHSDTQPSQYNMVCLNQNTVHLYPGTGLLYSGTVLQPGVRAPTLRSWM